MSDVEVEGVKLYGPLLVLHHLATGIGLREHLGPYANEILSMVYADTPWLDPKRGGD